METSTDKEKKKKGKEPGSATQSNHFSFYAEQSQVVLINKLV